MSDRVDAEIQWYSQKSKQCQTKYKFLRMVEIILASLIPLLAPYADKYAIVSFIIGSFGTVITVAGSISALFKYHENWLHYRTTCENLKCQKLLFLTSSYPYNVGKETRENIFVKNVESIISSENAQWYSVNAKENMVNVSGNNQSTGS